MLQPPSDGGGARGGRSPGGSGRARARGQRRRRHDHADARSVEFGISVTNPEPTQGGDRQETPIVTQADYDAAKTDLQNRLSGEGGRQLRDPAIVPEGLTLFAETGDLGSIEYRPAADAIVGSRQRPIST